MPCRTAGKTTLLNVLGGRALANMSGEMFLNGRPYSKAMRKQIAYVMQEDIFFTNLTVHEQLTFTCQLRLPASVSQQEKAAAVDHVIKTLGIEKCRHSQILLVSGGEKKRCNIGTELLTNPSLILLDEPTSGLDSTAAASLMKTMRGLAADRMTVMMSIHQPSSQVFYSFDKLVLLADGRMVFYGPPRQCLPYLAALGFVPPADYNPADFVMDLINATVAEADRGAEPVSADVDVEFDLCSIYVSSSPQSLEESAVKEMGCSPRDILIRCFDGSAHLSRVETTLSRCRPKVLQPAAFDVESALEMAETATTASDGSSAPVVKVEAESGHKYPLPYCSQLWVLFRRDFRNRRTELFKPYNIVECLFVGVIAGCAWYRLSRTEQSVNDRSALIFFGIIRWYFW